MQYEEKKLYLNKTIGLLLKDLRTNKSKLSLNQFANSYDIDKGGLSKIENGIVDSQISTLWKIVEALGIDFPEFARLLKEKLGDDFKFMDE